MRQSSDAVDSAPETKAGIGMVVKLDGPYALFSGGPTWIDRRTGYRGYAALGMNF